MANDIHGHSMSGASSEAAETYELALSSFNLYRGDPMALLATAISAAPEFAMAHILSAYLLVLSSEPEATAQARVIVAHTKALPINERETSHLAALDLAIAGEWTAAALALDRHSMRFPYDLVALQAGHLMDFYRANARDLRDRIARALPKWSAEMPGYSILLGLRAFGLEEMCDYGRAEEAGRRAIEMQPLDCWAHHAVSHVMEMQGRAEDGIAWMIAREQYWSGDANFFKVHNWWHKALYHLELGQAAEALTLYDGPIRADRSTVALDMVDASALLWRLHLAGHDVGDRWAELAIAWDAHADGRTYPFNDWHAVMAYLGAGREQDAARLARTYRDNGPATSETLAWGRRTAEPLIQGFIAFWNGNYSDAVGHLHGARFIANSFGGSHAQRDIIDWTLTEAAIRAGMRNYSEALANERLALRPHSPVNRKFLQQAQNLSLELSAVG